jgi:uncharacterized phage-associated protein
MAARLDSVCKLICEQGDWRVSNLQLQKILYIVQMIYMGHVGGKRLADASFEAWDYGPVEPTVYRKVRMFGSEPISNVFYNARVFNKEDERRNVIIDVSRDLLRRRASELVEITHWDKGAWAEHYVPGIRGIRIPDDAILAEFRRRIADGHLPRN